MYFQKSFQNFCMLFFLLGIIGYGIPSNATSEAPTKEEAATKAVDVTEQTIPITPEPTLDNIKQQLATFTKQDVTAVTSDILALYGASPTEAQLRNYIEMQTSIIERLRKFKVTGLGIAATAVDPNLAFIYSNQNPVISIYFKNPAGELKKRTYQASIKSVGFKFECVVNLQLFFFLDTDLNYFDDANKEIPLSWGGEVSIPLKYVFGGKPSKAREESPAGAIRAMTYKAPTAAEEGADRHDRFVAPPDWDMEPSMGYAGRAEGYGPPPPQLGQQHPRFIIPGNPSDDHTGQPRYDQPSGYYSPADRGPQGTPYTNGFPTWCPNPPPPQPPPDCYTSADRGNDPLPHTLLWTDSRYTSVPPPPPPPRDTLLEYASVPPQPRILPCPPARSGDGWDGDGWEIEDTDHNTTAIAPEDGCRCECMRKRTFGNSLMNFARGCYNYAIDKTPISYGSLSFTYASIKNNGGLLVVSLGLGLTDNIVSIVIGGSLKPVEAAGTSVTPKKTSH